MDYALEYPSIAARSPASARVAFIRRTYAHLAGAILAFAAIEWAIFNLIPAQNLDALMVTYFRSPFSNLILFAAFIGVGCVARWLAYSGASAGVQYAGLGTYILIEAVIFVPLLWVLTHYPNGGNPTEILTEAGILTLCLFGGLTAVVFITRKDFSFLGPILAIASFLVFGLIILAMIFGWSLGLWFAFGMVVLISGFILYDTSNVLHKFRTDMHVAAALELFASIAVLFYYIIMILMSRNSRS
jgi:FtsH-binding integral membrane protein